MNDDILQSPNKGGHYETRPKTPCIAGIVGLPGGAGPVCGRGDVPAAAEARAPETSLKENYGKFIKVYQTVIPVAVKAAETSAAGKSIYSYDKDSTVAKAYQAFTKEVVRDGERQRNQLQSSLSR